MWTLVGFVQPEIAEEYARNLTYQYAPNGADKSGWDIGQLLRVPLTTNFKKQYQAVGGAYPTVEVVRMLDLPVPDEVFESLPIPEGVPNGSAVDVGMPDVDHLPKAALVVERYWTLIENQPAFLDLFEITPETSDDWSKRQWRLIHMSLEAGMSTAETFAVVRAAKCNKYARDNRPERYLWLEVQKANNRQNYRASYALASENFIMPTIYEEGEATDFTFVDLYREWGSAATDAPPQFHDMGAFMVMSALMAGNLQLRVRHGVVRPNLWGLVLGESTLSRKTTTTRMAMELIASIDKDLLLATDGSVEGILSGMRSNAVGIFFRDEVSGFFDSMHRREYLSGMQEMMTQMYDVPPMVRRTLRKETIVVENPVFILFGGGIRENAYAALMERAVTSGFLPRFLIVIGDADVDDVKPLGPPDPVGTGFNVDEKSKPVMQHAHNMHNTYNRMQTVKLTGQGAEQEIEKSLMVDVELTPDAWERAQKTEMILLKAGHDTPLKPMMLPTMQRLHVSLLKMATLIGASRQEPNDKNVITVELHDVLSASKYIQQWGTWSIDAVMNVGKGTSERELTKYMRTIRAHPGISRTDLMRYHHLSKKQMDEIEGTLLDRGHIQIEKVGKATHYTALD